MSKFTFTGDASGTLTKKLLTRAEKIQELAASGDDRDEAALIAAGVIDAAGSEKMYEAETRQGADAERSFDTKGIRKKEFFNALQMKGLRVCEDLELAAGKDIIFLKGDGDLTDANEHFRARKIVKHIEMVYGYVDGSGDFHSADHLEAVVEKDGDLAAYDKSDPQAALESLANASPTSDSNSINDSLVPKEVQDNGSALGGTTNGSKWYLRIHLASGEILHREFEAVNDMLGQAGDSASTLSVLGQMKHIETLQDAARVALVSEGAARISQVEDLESMIDSDFANLVLHLEDMEDKLVAYIRTRDLEVQQFVLDRMDELHEDIDDAMESIKLHGTFGSLATASALTVEFLSPALDLAGTNIEEWAIDVACFVTSGSVVTRKDEFSPDWEAEIDGDNKLKITAEVVSCTDGQAPTEWVVNAVYCGDTAADVLDHNRGNAVFSGTALGNIDLVLRDTSSDVAGDVSAVAVVDAATTGVPAE